MRGYAAIGLSNPKTNINVGSALRACHCYDAKLIAITGRRFKKVCTDTFNTHKHLPLIEVEDLQKVIPFNCVPVAVELLPEAESLITYKHPERAFYIFGPEDGTLGKSITSWCRDIIYIPTKNCMNLAATVNVVLYDRMFKQETK